MLSIFGPSVCCAHGTSTQGLGAPLWCGLIIRKKAGKRNGGQHLGIETHGTGGSCMTGVVQLHSTHFGRLPSYCRSNERYPCYR